MPKHNKSHSGPEHHVYHHLPQYLSVLVAIVLGLAVIAGVKIIFSGGGEVVGEGKGVFGSNKCGSVPLSQCSKDPGLINCVIQTQQGTATMSQFTACTSKWNQANKKRDQTEKRVLLDLLTCTTSYLRGEIGMTDLTQCISDYNRIRVSKCGTKCHIPPNVVGCYGDYINDLVPLSGVTLCFSVFNSVPTTTDKDRQMISDTIACIQDYKNGERTMEELTKCISVFNQYYFSGRGSDPNFEGPLPGIRPISTETSSTDGGVFGGGKGKLHPADTNKDWRLILSETVGFNTKAVKGSNLWKGGEFYDWDRNTNDWVNRNPNNKVQASAQYLHPADTNKDWRLILSETVGFNTLAVKGSNLWKGGEYYTWDRNANDWVNIIP